MEKISVFPDVSSDFSINFLVEDIRINLRFIWNTLTEFWMINEYLEPDTGKRATGIKGVPGYPLTENIPTSLKGALIIWKTDKEIGDEITYDNFGKGWDLLYITEEEYNNWETNVGL